MPPQDATVAATGTSLRVIEALEGLGGAGVTQVADELGIAKSTVHNHLRTLEEAGYVVHEEGVYRVGLRFLELGEYTRNRMAIYEEARPEVLALAEETGETANAAVEEHGEAVYLARAEGDQAVNVDAHAGKRVYLHCTALGKAILAELPESRVDEIVAARGLPERTENTITDREELDTELAAIRERGYAYDHGERLPRLRCVAAPIVAEERGVIAALSVSGPATRIQGERFHEEIPERLRSAANVVEINIAYS